MIITRRGFSVVVVSFSGLDGAGKSTQIEALTEWLQKRGVKVTYLWARGGYTPGFQAFKGLVRRIRRRGLPAPGTSAERTKAMARPMVARVWLSLSLIDLILYWGGYLRLQRLLGRFAICDRYIDDTRLDFRRNFPTVPFERMWLWRVLEWITPRPHAAFLLWIPVEESMRRSKEKGEPFPDDEETLTWRLAGYMDESVFSSDQYIRLDGLRSVEAILKEIIGKVAVRLGQGGRADAA